MAVREFTVGSRPQAVWGWLVVLDFFLAGSGSGLFIFSLTLGNPLGMTVGVILVLLGGALLLADLTRPANAWRVITRTHSSWLSRGTVSIMVFTILAIVHIVYLSASSGGNMVSNTTWQSMPGGQQVLAIIAGVAAAAVALYPGFLLGSMRGIPLWSSIVSPALFLLSALIAGLGIASILPLNLNNQGTYSVFYGLGAGLVLLQTLVLLSLILSSQTEVLKASVQKLTRSTLKFHFYFGVLLMGLIAPFLFLIASLFLFSGNTILPLAAGILLLEGQLLLRYCLVKAGLYVSPV